MRLHTLRVREKILWAEASSQFAKTQCATHELFANSIVNVALEKENYILENIKLEREYKG